MLRGAPCDGPRKIRFTDETIETRSIVELFVNLAVDRQAAFNLTSLENDLWPKKVDGSILHGIDKIMTLLAFLWKWDCGPVLETLASELELLMKCGTLSPRDVFCLGAILDDPELCTASLAFNQTTRIWPPLTSAVSLPRSGSSHGPNICMRSARLGFPCAGCCTTTRSVTFWRRPRRR